MYALSSPSGQAPRRDESIFDKPKEMSNDNHKVVYFSDSIDHESCKKYFNLIRNACPSFIGYRVSNMRRKTVLFLDQKGVWEEDASSEKKIKSFFPSASKVSKVVNKAHQLLFFKSDVQPGKYNEISISTNKIAEISNLSLK